MLLCKHGEQVIVIIIVMVLVVVETRCLFFVLFMGLQKNQRVSISLQQKEI